MRLYRGLPANQGFRAKFPKLWELHAQKSRETGRFRKSIRFTSNPPYTGHLFKRSYVAHPWAGWHPHCVLIRHSTCGHLAPFLGLFLLLRSWFTTQQKADATTGGFAQLQHRHERHSLRFFIAVQICQIRRSIQLRRKHLLSQLRIDCGQSFRHILL